MPSHSALKELSLPVTIALSLVSLGVGYFLGSKSSTNRLLPPASPSSLHSPTSTQVLTTLDSTVASVLNTDKTDEESTDDEDETLADGDLGSIKAGIMEPCKMVLVVRTDLGMTTGKIAAQCGHATLACYKALIKTNPALLKHWERIGQAKIALKANSEDQLLELEAIAKSLNLCARSILDAGRTQIAAGSRTVLAIGPAPVPLINQVTGHLRLL